MSSASSSPVPARGTATGAGLWLGAARVVVIPCLGASKSELEFDESATFVWGVADRGIVSAFLDSLQLTLLAMRISGINNALDGTVIGLTMAACTVPPYINTGVGHMAIGQGAGTLVIGG